jgi:MoaA/NifB/PqqE/SkfB family radical SAM enzyme
LGGGVRENRAPAEKFGEIARLVKPLIAQLSGGEPLLRSDLEDIVRELRIPDRAPYIVVTTNGILLTRDRYDSLRRAGVDEFSISLDYPDERHDEFRGVPGLFRRIQTLVESLDSGGDKAITLCCVIQSDNFRDLPKMVELAEKWNVRLNLSTYTFLRTKNMGYMISGQDLEEFKSMVVRLKEFRRQRKPLFTSEYVFDKMVSYFEQGQAPRCQTGVRFCNVNPDGTFSPCGLIITRYETLKEFKTDFLGKNDCVYCLTSLRANCEKPVRHLIKDALRAL